MPKDTVNKQKTKQHFLERVALKDGEKKLFFERKGLKDEKGFSVFDFFAGINFYFRPKNINADNDLFFMQEKAGLDFDGETPQSYFFAKRAARVNIEKNNTNSLGFCDNVGRKNTFLANIINNGPDNILEALDIARSAIGEKNFQILQSQYKKIFDNSGAFVNNKEFFVLLSMCGALLDEEFSIALQDFVDCAAGYYFAYLLNFAFFDKNFQNKSELSSNLYALLSLPRFYLSEVDIFAKNDTAPFTGAIVEKILNECLGDSGLFDAIDKNLDLYKKYPDCDKTKQNLIRSLYYSVAVINILFFCAEKNILDKKRYNELFADYQQKLLYLQDDLQNAFNCIEGSKIKDAEKFDKNNYLDICLFVSLAGNLDICNGNNNLFRKYASLLPYCFNEHDLDFELFFKTNNKIMARKSERLENVISKEKKEGVPDDVEEKTNSIKIKDNSKEKDGAYIFDKKFEKKSEKPNAEKQSEKNGSVDEKSNQADALKLKEGFLLRLLGLLLLILLFPRKIFYLLSRKKRSERVGKKLKKQLVGFADRDFDDMIEDVVCLRGSDKDLNSNIDGSDVQESYIIVNLNKKEQIKKDTSSFSSEKQTLNDAEISCVENAGGIDLEIIRGAKEADGEKMHNRFSIKILNSEKVTRDIIEKIYSCVNNKLFLGQESDSLCDKLEKYDKVCVKFVVRDGCGDIIFNCEKSIKDENEPSNKDKARIDAENEALKKELPTKEYILQIETNNISNGLKKLPNSKLKLDRENDILNDNRFRSINI